MAGTLEVGDKLQAKCDDGVYYLGEVMAISDATSRKKAPVKVKFMGCEEEKWMALDDLRSKKIKKEPATTPAPVEAAQAVPAADYSALVVGTKLQAAADGVYYLAEVVTVSSAKNRSRAPVKVHFAGYDAKEDAWLPLDRLRSKLIPKQYVPLASVLKGLDVGMRLHAEYKEDGEYYVAKVVAVSLKQAKAPVKVNYAGYGSEFDAWLPLDKLRSKAIPKDAGEKAPPTAKTGTTRTLEVKTPATAAPKALEKGTKLQAMGPDGNWYAADVVATSVSQRQAKAPVKVHFVGHDEQYDMWMPLDKLYTKLIPKGADANSLFGRSQAVAPKSSSSKAMRPQEFDVGMKLHAMGPDDVWYAAEVVQLATNQNSSTPVKVHFLGYGDEYNLWLSTEKLHPKGGDKGKSKGKGEGKAFAGKGKGKY